MATPAVGFSRGSSSRFPDIIKDPNTMYFITDTKEIFLGADRYAFGKDVTINVTGVGDCITDITWDLASKTLGVTKGNAGDAVSVRELLDEALEDYVMNVTAPRDSAINVDNTDPQNPVLSLKIATDPEHEGNVKFDQCSEGLYANVEIPEVPVSGVAPDDKIISVDHTLLKSTLGITTTKDAATDKTYIELQGIGGQTISRFDATSFVKHGLLKDARIDYKSPGPGIAQPWLILEFWVYDDQSTASTIVREVNLTDLIDTYYAKAGGGLKLENGEFSIENEVNASSGLNDNVNLEFGRTATLNTIMYDSHGCITGQKTFTVTVPGLSGSVGAADNSKVVTFVGLGSDGQLIGNALDITDTLSTTSTDNQVPTAKATFDAIADAMAIWNTFD